MGGDFDLGLGDQRNRFPEFFLNFPNDFLDQNLYFSCQNSWWPFLVIASIGVIAFQAIVPEKQ